MLCHPTDRNEVSRMPTESPPEPELSWCNYAGCEKHPSPTGAPKRIQPTWGELAAHKDAEARWNSYQIPRVSNQTKTLINALIDTSETDEENTSAHQYATLAGMCYWSIKKGDWIWR